MPGRGAVRDVRDAVVDQVLVHLVADRDQVVRHTKLGDGRQLLAGEHGPGRVVRRVQQDRPGAWSDRRPQCVEIEREPAGGGLGDQRNRPPGGAGEGDGRGVGVVVGLEEDHLVARLDQRQQGGGDGLGGADGDQDLGVRVEGGAVAGALGGDGRAQFGAAEAGWVLVVPVADRALGLGQHAGRAVGVREALTEVDRPGPVRQRRHLGEDRRGERPQPGYERTWGHDHPSSRTMAVCSN